MQLRKRNKLIWGVGINDADYNVVEMAMVNGKQKIVSRCPFYSRWQDMLRRCYDTKFHQRSPTYSDCSVVPEWFYFSNFKSWMELQDWEEKALDKDILFKGNKIYGPDKCIFVDTAVNTFFIEKASTDLPVGVSFDKVNNKFVARCKSISTGKYHNLGRYSSPEEASEAWLKFKIEQIYYLISQQTVDTIIKALLEKISSYEALGPY